MPVTWTVRNIMARDILSVDSETSANDAIALMAEKDVGGLVVTREGKPAGIVTERDIIKKCGREGSYKGVEVGQIMSEPLITIKGDATIGDAAWLMSDKNIRRLLVTEKGEIKGIVTGKDIMREILTVFKNLLTTAKATELL
jgi:CBS domain-containing protein